MRGSFCTLTEDGILLSLGSGWSHNKMHAHLQFFNRQDAILDFRGFFISLSNLEGQIIYQKTPETSVCLTVSQTEELCKYSSVF